jgi:hypothetical protein
MVNPPNNMISLGEMSGYLLAALAGGTFFFLETLLRKIVSKCMLHPMKIIL